MGPIKRRDLIKGAAATALMARFDAARAAAPAILPSAPFNLRRVQGLASLDDRLVRRAFGNSNFPINAGYTYGSLWSMEAPFDWIRLHYINGGSSVGQLIASVAASSASNDGVTPVGGTLTPVTFNAGGAEAAPGYPLGASGTTNATLSLATGTVQQPMLSASDYIPLKSIPSTDGSGLFYAMVRSYVSATFSGQYNPDFADYKAAVGARAVRGFVKSGDFVTTPGAYTAGESGYVMPCAVEVISRTLGATVLTIGDSITQGTGTTSQAAGWPGTACAAISTPALPVSWACAGLGSHVTSDFFAHGKMCIDAFGPKIVVIAPFSPNDPGTSQGTVDAGWYNAMALYRYCLSKGAVPILWTPIPFNLTSAQDAFRQQICARVRAMGDAGALVIDLDAVIADPASPMVGLAAFIAGAGTPHPNDMGNQAMAAAAVPVLQRALGVL